LNPFLLSFVQEGPRNYNQMSCGLKNYVGSFNCVKCGCVRDKKSLFASELDNNGRALKTSLKKKSAFSVLNGPSYLDVLTKEITGVDQTFDNYLKKLDGQSRPFVINRFKYNIFLEHMKDDVVIELYGPRGYSNINGIRYTNDPAIAGSAASIVVCNGVGHLMSDLLFQAMANSMSCGDRFFFRGSDATFLDDIKKFLYVNEIHFSGKKILYEDFLRDNLFFFRSKMQMDSLLGNWFFLVEEGKTGEDSLRYYSQIWVKKPQDGKKFSFVHGTFYEPRTQVHGDTVQTTGRTGIKERREIVSWIKKECPSFGEPEVIFWASRVLTGAITKDQIPRSFKKERKRSEPGNQVLLGEYYLKDGVYHLIDPQVKQPKRDLNIGLVREIADFIRNSKSKRVFKDDIFLEFSDVDVEFINDVIGRMVASQQLGVTFSKVGIGDEVIDRELITYLK